MEVVREAITKELERKGQVFYLYNKVEGIEKKKEEVEKLIPEARVRICSWENEWRRT